MYRSRQLGVFLLLVLMSVLGTRAAIAQETAGFEVDAMSVRGEEDPRSTRVDLYTKVPYSQLTFINTPNGFTATYEVTAEVYELDDRNRRQNLIQTRIWESSAVTSTFAATQSQQLYDHTTHSIHLTPGRYLIEFQLVDQNTQEMLVRELALQVRNLTGPVVVSDILLIEKYDEQNNTIYPMVSSSIGTDQLGFQMFYEIYADGPQRVRVKREVIHLGKQGSGAIEALPVAEDGQGAAVTGTVSYAHAEPVALQRGRNQAVVQIPLEAMKAGEYLIRVRVEDKNGRLLDEALRTFVARWSGLAEHLTDLDEAIEQLQYIAKAKDLKRIKEAESYAERMQRFLEFWEKRDPTPRTPRNERMEEYYYRIAFANREYGSVTEGWKTDRGQVMVLFGEPDHVERHPYSFDVKPYEVWYYYRIGRQFIFIDNTGFGDYELLVPIWDERTRIR